MFSLDRALAARTVLLEEEGRVSPLGRAGVGDVASDAHPEEDRLLLHERHARAQPRRVERRDVDAVEADLAAADVVEA